MPDLVLGVDPGLHGALACLRLTGEAVGVWPMPVTKGRRREVDARALAEMIARLDAPESGVEPRIALVAVEDVHSMPGQGVASVFSFGRCCGAIEGVLASMNLARELVAPQRWQKEVIGLPARGGDPKARRKATKARSLAYARRRFPSVSLVPEGCRVEHDGLSDSLAICEWARRLVLGEIHKTA
jgi:crossover junction endodeoxyribonuclease RuvC